MEKFKAYRLTETPEKKIRAEIVDMQRSTSSTRATSRCAWRIRA